MAKRPARSQAKPAAARTPLLEWVVAPAGLALILAAIGLILFDGLNGKDVPPGVVVAAVRTTPAAGGWTVQFEARNLSRRPAAEVQVTGVLTAAGGELERRSVTLDYIPGEGLRKGGLLFRHDPRAGRLELAAEGYREP